jgi:hypothetical protein
LVVDSFRHALETGDVTTATEDGHLVVGASVATLAALEDGGSLVAAKLQVADDFEEAQRAHTADELLGETAEEVGLLAELPLDVLGLARDLGRLAVGGHTGDCALFKAAALEHGNETLGSLDVAVVLGDVKRQLCPLFEGLALVRVEAVLLLDVGV